MMKKILKNELVSKILFTLFMMFVMELGRQLVIPSLDSTMTRATLSSSPFLRNFSSVTGGQINYPALFSVGLGPYMTGMILFSVIQMLNTDMMKKLSSYQTGMLRRLIVLVLSILQSFQMLYTIRKHVTLSGVEILGIDYNFIVSFFILVAGAMTVGWLADMLVVKGSGGGGMLIIPGLVSMLPRTLRYGRGLGTVYLKLTPKLTLIIVCIIVLLMIITIYINKAEIHIPLERPTVSNNFSQSYMPFRILSGGGMQFMYATTLFMIPSYIASFGVNEKTRDLINTYITYDHPIGIVIYAAIVVLLGYAFSFMTIRPEDTAEDLKKSGDYIFGYRPGNDTEALVKHHLLLLSTISNVYVVIVLITPLIIGLYIPGISNLSFAFSSVLILIIMLDSGLEQIKVLYLRSKYNLLDL